VRKWRLGTRWEVCKVEMEGENRRERDWEREEKGKGVWGEKRREGGEI